eukprot:gb/GECG01007527.1/.p1 GENE.gb/GECG01007527.1/~~gb/GECG01007527.1/.p1  ORF type:complete len:1206 (+),score=172.29 gb/GECG01007527.1/:1-3618(+)
MTSPQEANTTVHQGLGGPLSLYRYLGSKQPLYLQRNIRAVAPQMISQNEQKESESGVEEENKGQESNPRGSTGPDIKIPKRTYHRPRNGIDAKIRFHEIRLRVPRETFESLFIPPEKPLKQLQQRQEETTSSTTSVAAAAAATLSAGPSKHNSSTIQTSTSTSSGSVPSTGANITMSRSAATATPSASSSSVTTSWACIRDNSGTEEQKGANDDQRKNRKRSREEEQEKEQGSEDKEDDEIQVPHTPWCYAVVSFLTKRSSLVKGVNFSSEETNESEANDTNTQNESEQMYIIHQHAAAFVPSKPWLASDAFREYSSSDDTENSDTKVARKIPRHEILSYETSDKMHREASAMHDIAFRVEHPSPVEQTLPGGVPCPRECFRINYDSVVAPKLSLKDAVNNLVDEDSCVRGTLLALPHESKILKSLTRALDGERYNVIFVNSPDELCGSRNFTYEQLSAPIRGVKRLHIAKFFDCPLDESVLTDNEITVRVSLIPRKSSSTYPSAAENGETNRRVDVPIPPEAVVASTAMIPSITMLRHLNGHMRNSECAARVALLGQLAHAASNIHSSSLDPKFLHERILDLQKLGVGTSWRAAARVKDPTRLKCLASNAVMGQVPEKSEAIQLLRLIPLSSDKVEDLVSQNLTCTLYQRLWSDALLNEQGKKGSSSLLWTITPNMLNTLGYPKFHVDCKRIYSSTVNCHKGRNRCFIPLNDFEWKSNNRGADSSMSQAPGTSSCYSVQTLSVRNLLAGIAQRVSQPYKSLLRVGRKFMSYSENSAVMRCGNGASKLQEDGESLNHIFVWHFWSLRREPHEWCHVLQRINTNSCALCQKDFLGKEELFLHLETNHYRCRIGIHEDTALPRNSQTSNITKGAVKILLAKSPSANSVRPLHRSKRFWHVHIVPQEDGNQLKNDLDTAVDKKFVDFLWFGEESRKAYKGHLFLNFELLNWRNWQLRTIREPVVRGHWVYHNHRPQIPAFKLERKAKARAMIECDMPPELLDKSIQESRETVSELSRYPRQYFHSQTGQPIQPHEEDIDSDDDVKDAWVLERSSAVIDSFEDASSAEKKFMKLWNSHVFELGVYADRVVPRVCLLFARRFTSEISRQNLRFQFLLHMLTLWDFAILDTRTLHYCLRIVDSYNESHGKPSQLAKRRPSQLVLPLDDTSATGGRGGGGGSSSTTTSGGIRSVDESNGIEEDDEEVDITEI